MKTFLLFMLFASGSVAATAAQEVTDLQQHQAFFASRAQLAANAGLASELQKRASALAANVDKPIQKGEFETTAEFQQRQLAHKTALRRQLAELDEAAAKGEAEATRLKARIREQESGLSAITVVLKLTMGRYDADQQTISAFTPEASVLGSYDDRAAIIAFDGVLPGLKCSPEAARRLREASDRGELVGIVQFESPKLTLTQERTQIAATTGDKWTEALAKLAVGALAGDQAAGIDPSISKTKEANANTIRIEKASGVRHLKFFNKAGAIPVQ